MNENAALNTDRELWRRKDDYYADSIHVTENGQIGISCEGRTIVMPVEDWHRLGEFNFEFDDLPWWKQWIIMQLLGD